MEILKLEKSEEQTTKTMIEIKNLHKTFDNKMVLKGVNLNIKTGRTIALNSRDYHIIQAYELKDES